MKAFVLLATLMLPSSFVHAAESYGKLTLAPTAAKPLKTVLSEYKDGSAAPVLVQGTVKKVCEKEGCWMVLEDQGESVRVFFKDHSFFVTQKIKDKAALAEGILHKKTRTVAQQKHLLEDAGESAKTIAAVKEDKVFFELEATGIKAL
ncbi:MAG TPA: DUF4920 domain-containing protein [Oligoflexus sp.]|uniref:DUF4920 domain-containing protein n=1 Tax=Oligoflexus sp. TaxID=1971216 RepID=UPI002D7E82D4|nr:DUF4920 domain-containing protein [Oligoflexus sp.]HET9236819.1 DUF4920 domain-containing protein [Oligoflexus sp.]